MRFLAALLTAVAFSCSAADAPKAAEAKAAPVDVVQRDLKVRTDFIRNTPLPAKCRGQICEVDHKVPLHKGGPDSVENMQWLTRAEHAAKTAGEARERAAERRADKNDKAEAIEKKQADKHRAAEKKAAKRAEKQVAKQKAAEERAEKRAAKAEARRNK